MPPPGPPPPRRRSYTGPARPPGRRFEPADRASADHGTTRVSTLLEREDQIAAITRRQRSQARDKIDKTITPRRQPINHLAAA
jgi:hypothetical protein